MVLCLEGIPVTPYTDVTAREETVTHGERGNQVRNGQVRQQIILILFFKNKTSLLLSQDGFTCRIVGEIQSLINRHDRVEVKVVFSRGDLQNERQKFGRRLHIGSLREEIQRCYTRYARPT